MLLARADHIAELTGNTAVQGYNGLNGLSNWNTDGQGQKLNLPKVAGAILCWG